MPVDRIGILRAGLGHELQRDVAVQARVLGLPDHTHPTFADLLDQAVVEQLLSGLRWPRLSAFPQVPESTRETRKSTVRYDTDSARRRPLDESKTLSAFTRGTSTVSQHVDERSGIRWSR